MTRLTLLSTNTRRDSLQPFTTPFIEPKEGKVVMAVDVEGMGLAEKP